MSFAYGRSQTVLVWDENDLLPLFPDREYGESGMGQSIYTGSDDKLFKLQAKMICLKYNCTAKHL